ncbi:MAG: hypothetical protein G01um101438_1057 [Parcubacteria group bacterium Gr01-1014_38]|nr:MAG: hypothetical protein G01um101438_1057 [Parcubacteria group bacterium Gr01-1014_38]
MVSESTSKSLELRSCVELAEIAKGPSKYEVCSPDLSRALEAITVLGIRAASDLEAVAAMLEVIQATNWWVTLEQSLDAVLTTANADQLQWLARSFYDDFWQEGDYGGGVVIPWRLKRVVDRLLDLGVPLEQAVPGVDAQLVQELITNAREEYKRFYPAAT